MTEYEHAILFFELAQAASAVMANYMAIVSAFVVVAYVVSHRLDNVLTIIAVFIYSLFALGLTNEIFQIYSDLSRLGIQIEAKFGAIPETDLGWFGPLATGPEFLYVLPKIIFTMLSLTYLGSLFFFFHRRHQLRGSLATGNAKNKSTNTKTTNNT